MKINDNPSQVILDCVSQCISNPGKIKDMYSLVKKMRGEVTPANIECMLKCTTEFRQGIVPQFQVYQVVEQWVLANWHWLLIGILICKIMDWL